MERLYLPDFSAIFGKMFANPLLYAKVDSLIWPIFNDLEPSSSLENLLSLNDDRNHPVFYHRGISTEDLKVELSVSDIQIGCVQAIDIGRNYGISNDDVINVIEKLPNLLFGILSFSLTEKKEDLISKLVEFEESMRIVGYAIYPSYSKLDLLENHNESLNNLIDFCKNNKKFLKIDVGNFKFPDFNPNYISADVIRSFCSKHSDLNVILSGLDIDGTFPQYYSLVRQCNNLWIEIDPRSIGGITPTMLFKRLFNFEGFIQNCWKRIIIGSATPTLESSQIVRAFLESMQNQPFSHQCLMNAWAFRNINRMNDTLFKPLNGCDPALFSTQLENTILKVVETDNEVNIYQKIKLRSFGITQLIFITDIIKDIFKKASQMYPQLKFGELFLRSYHTTTSLIINEHEYGNFLDLHYHFAELSRKDSTEFLHTVSALENRADFNHFDHLLATEYGSKDLTIPILNGKLEIGSRENFYILVTFGPRTFNLFLKIKFLKPRQEFNPKSSIM